MALIANEKYEQRKVDRLADHLKIYAEKERPIDFEIIVDGFRAVRRTNDLEMFTLYENYVDADTKSIEFILYTGNSNNNDKHIFYFGNPPKGNALNGLDVDEQIKAGVDQQMREKHYAELEVKNKLLEKEVKELEEEVEELEKQNAGLQASQSPLNGVFGQVGANILESLIKRNPKIMASIPGGTALAGLLESSDAIPIETVEESSEISFKPKAQTETELTEEDRNAILFVNQLKSQFTRAEFEKVDVILQAIANDKTMLDQLLEQLTTKNE